MKRFALLALVAAVAVYYLRHRTGASAGGREDAAMEDARDSRSFGPVCAALRKDLAKVDQPLGAPHADLQFAHDIRQRIQTAAATSARPGHAALIQVCDLLIRANEERDVQRVRLLSQTARPRVNSLETGSLSTSTPEPKRDLGVSPERRWEEQRQPMVATARRLLTELEGKASE